MRVSTTLKRISDHSNIQGITRSCLILVLGLSLIAPSILMAQPSVKGKAKGFFTVRPDYRKCISPLCGGYWISLVNRRKTPCIDGTARKECYVASINWNPVDLTPEEIQLVDQLIAEGRILLQGKVVKRTWEGFGVLGELRVTRVLVSASDKKPVGDFVQLKENGIECVTVPCFNINEAHLNRKGFRLTVSRVDLLNVNASQEDIDEALESMEDDGLFAVGSNKPDPFPGPGENGVRFDVSNFYLPLVLEDDGGGDDEDDGGGDDEGGN